MTVKVGLISDVHATPAPLQEALQLFQDRGIEIILCAGDIAGYGSELDRTIELLIASQCQVIIGNHDLWWLSRADDREEGRAAQYLRTLPRVIELSLAGKELYMVHASPPDFLMQGITLLDDEGSIMPEQKEFWIDYLGGFPFDLLVVGHTHQLFVEQLGEVLVVNPGSTRFNNTCAVLSLPEMTVEIIPLSGKRVVPTLSWAKGGPVNQ